VSIAFSRDGSQPVSGSIDFIVKVWKTDKVANQ
jgi:hypothetical protein